MSRPNRRRAVRAVAPVAGLLAAGLLVWQGSYAAFSASTDNTANAWSTGRLVLTNNGGGTTYPVSGTTTGIFGGTGQNETGMKIGASGTKCITVESTGTLPGNIRLSRGTIGGTGNSTGLAAALQVTVTAIQAGAVNVPSDCSTFPTGTATSIYTGSITGMPTAYGSQTPMPITGAATQRVAYRFAWSLPAGANNAADNLLQNSSVTADFVWEIQ